MIDYSFCIVTDNSLNACKRIAEIVKSIRGLQIPNYEILVIGGDTNRFVGNFENFQKINFCEKTKNGWITKKKNDVAKLAKYENLVMMHDYFVFHPSWYKGYIAIKDKFENCDLCLNPIIMSDGRRDYTDWVTLDHPTLGMHRSLSYTDEANVKYQYFSGGFFVVKKNFFLNNLMDESLLSHQMEDIEWSKRIRDNSNIIFNANSYVRHNKDHRNLSVDFWSRIGV
jgi:hypothetical protein